MKGWESTRFDELDAVPLFEGIVWHPVRRRLGIRAFGINAYTSEGVGQLVIEEHDVVRDGEIVVRRIGNISVTFDHRVNDGAGAAKFLTRLVGYLEDPASVFIESA